MSATSDIIAVRVRDLRAKRGMTLQQLADACDASKSWVWEIEQGRARNPTIDMAVKLANAFGVSLDYLTGLSTQTAASAYAFPLGTEEYGELIETLTTWSKMPHEEHSVADMMSVDCGLAVVALQSLDRQLFASQQALAVQAIIDTPDEVILAEAQPGDEDMVQRAFEKAKARTL